jgi:hypothetical protein
MSGVVKMNMPVIEGEPDEFKDGSDYLCLVIINPRFKLKRHPENMLRSIIILYPYKKRKI